DYMLRVLTTDLTAYQELFDGPLGALPGVRKLSSTLVMKQVTGPRALPIGSRTAGGTARSPYSSSTTGS
ncbi:Lrp/AsnC ligand binding domain-containing protein, partial [Bacillus sp. SIMBA_074]